MALGDPDRLATFLRREIGDQLRSVVHYTADGYEIVHIRDDVGEQYSDDEMDRIGQDLGLTAFGKPFFEDLYVHGDLECSIHCFENAIEMQFVVSESEGIAVALDPAAFLTHRTFVARCLEEMGFEDGRTQADRDP